ncbi:MAG: ester cyclase [Saprospiraceae bacterium]
MKNTTVFTLTLFLSLFVISSGSAQSLVQNKETTKKILAAVDAGDLVAFSKYVSPAVVEHMPFPPNMPAGSDFEKSKALIAGFHAGFPDAKTTIVNMVAEGDLVIVQSVWTGTNTGSFMGAPATGKPVKIDQVDIIRYDNTGKGVEHWAVLDQLGMMQQLGMMELLGAMPGGGN